MEVYLGKHGNAPEKNQGQRVVKEMTNIWKNSDGCVTTDNFFTDIILAEKLLENNIFLGETVRKNKRDIPRKLSDTRNRCKYFSEFLFTNKLSLVSYIPKPRKCVILLSSLHHEHNISSEAENYKSEIIKYHNRTKTVVDVLDKLMGEYSCRRYTRRWP